MLLILSVFLLFILAALVAMSLRIMRKHFLRSQKIEKRLEKEKTHHSQTKQELNEGTRQWKVSQDILVSKLSYVSDLQEGGNIFKAPDEKQWKEIREFLEAADGMFVTRLSTRFPQLKEKDLQLCMLVRLGLSTSVLAAAFYISEDSMKKKQLRLKEKLGVSHETSLRKFIEDF